MRQIYLILLLSLLTISCKNIQKLVDQGRYDEAIDYAVRKLAGKEHKETKYVKALEEAYAKITLRDLNEIDRLKSRHRTALAGQIHDIYIDIMDRQARISPFLPLISEDYYAASFAMYNFNDEIKQYGDIAAEYEYSQASIILERARVVNNRFLAREALQKLNQVDKYTLDYKDVELLKEEASILGITDVLVSIKNSSYSYIPYRLEDRLLSQINYELDGRWINYDTKPRKGIQYDVELIYDLRDIDASNDSEIIRHHIDKKKVVIAIDTIKKEIITTLPSGQERVDVEIKTEEITAIKKAKVTEIIRSKTLYLEGQILILDAINGELVKKETVDITTDFYDESAYYRGDKEAIKKSRNHDWNKAPLPFPSTDDMLATAVDLTNDQVYALARNTIR